VLSILDDMVTEGLVTIEKAEIRIYRGRTKAGVTAEYSGR
jgi:hypothetical protein